MKKWTTAVVIFLALTEILVICSLLFGLNDHMVWAERTLIAGGVSGWLTIFAFIGEKVAERRSII